MKLGKNLAPTSCVGWRMALAIVGLAAILAFPDNARAQFAGATAEAPASGDGSQLLTPEELNALVAPIALYPDDLLAIVLPASTNPIQVIEAQRFLDQRKTDPNLKPDESWDPSIIALVNYPDVVKKMSDDIGWCGDLGNALLDQQEDVLNAIQAARGSATEAGYLQSNDQVTVVNEGDNVTIESTNPDVIYVPQYDPAPVIYNNYTNYPPPHYSDPYPPYWYPTATFFAGAFVGAAFAYGFDWNNGDIDIDNDIDISRGDTNIGSGNNIDRTQLQNRFNGERKANSDNMKWSAQRARQNSSTTRRATTGQRPSSANIQRQLGTNSPAQFRSGGQRATQLESQRGRQSLSQGNNNPRQVRQNNVDRQRMTPSNQVRRQPSQGGIFAGQGGGQFRQQSIRGNQSMNRRAGGGGRPPRAGGGRR